MEKKELEKDEKKEEKPYRKISLLIVLLVFVLYIIILCVADFLGAAYGKIIENVSLVIIGIILAIMLVKNKSNNNKE